MIYPESIKGKRLVDAMVYYNCKCGAPRSGTVLLTSFEGVRAEQVLLTGDGLIMSRAALRPEDLSQWRDGIKLIREVGREPCSSEGIRPELGDHVYYDWEFTEPVDSV